MKRIISYLSASSIRWSVGMVFLFIVIAFSSCSTSKEASYAYLDDIYKPNSEKFYSSGYYIEDDEGGVASQDGSVVKPYEPAVRDYWPYVKPLNFHIAFSYSHYMGYSYYNRWPFNWGYDNYCYRNGWSRSYCNYRRYNSSYSYYQPYFDNDYYSFYPGNSGSNYNNDYYGGTGGTSGGSYLFGNDVRYFKGTAPVDKRSSYAINYSKYSNYRAGGTNESVNGRKSGSKGKSRFQSSYNNSNKSGTSRSSNSGSSYRSSSSGGSSGRSSSPSRSSGSGGGTYSGKRPR